MKKIYPYILSIGVVLCVFLIYKGESVNAYTIKEFHSDKPFLTFDFSSLRDTLYTLKDSFIEVNLENQHAYLYTRDGEVFTYKISSGTDKIEKGIKTKEGIFVVQSLMPKWHSRQFDSTLLLNWIGFNYGIGFHALLGDGYYEHLGVRKSSHGCVRISREDGKHLYSLVEFGTPVLVHYQNNAVFFGFGDSSETYYSYSYREMNSVLRQRYESLYRGYYFYEVDEKILIDRSNVDHPGLYIGDASQIPDKQFIRPKSIEPHRLAPDILHTLKYIDFTSILMIDEQ